METGNDEFLLQSDEFLALAPYLLSYLLGGGGERVKTSEDSSGKVAWITKLSRYFLIYSNRKLCDAHCSTVALLTSMRCHRQYSLISVTVFCFCFLYVSLSLLLFDGYLKGILFAFFFGCIRWCDLCTSTFSPNKNSFVKSIFRSWIHWHQIGHGYSQHLIRIVHTSTVSFTNFLRWIWNNDIRWPLNRNNFEVFNFVAFLRISEQARKWKKLANNKRLSILMWRIQL